MAVSSRTCRGRPARPRRDSDASLVRFPPIVFEEELIGSGRQLVVRDLGILDEARRANQFREHLTLCCIRQGLEFLDDVLSLGCHDCILSRSR